MQLDTLKISVADDLKYLQLEPYLKAEVEDIMEQTPGGARVSLAVERQSQGVEAKIHFNHPTKQFNVKGEGVTPLVAIGHALNRFESLIFDWIHDQGYDRSSLKITIWTRDPVSAKKIESFLMAQDLRAEALINLTEFNMMSQLIETDVLFCEWPHGASILKEIEERFLQTNTIKTNPLFPKPVVLILQHPEESFQFRRTKLFFPIGTLVKEHTPDDSRGRIDKYLDFVLRNKISH